MMAPEQGPNRLNMKFTDDGRKVVIHLLRRHCGMSRFVDSFGAVTHSRLVLTSLEKLERVL